MPADRFGNRRDEDMFVSLDGGTGLGSVSRSSSDREIGDTPSDYERHGEAAVAWNYLGMAVSRRRIAAFFVVVFVAMLAITARVAQMQVIDGQQYRDLAEGNRIRVEWTPSERGVMYDREGQELVRNIPQFDLTVTPADLPTDQQARQQIILRLAEMLKLGPAEIEDRLAVPPEQAGQAVVVAEQLTHEQAILASIESSRTGAVQLSVGTRRLYADTAEVPSLSHLLGYEGRVTEEEVEEMPSRSLPTDMVGRTGLERSYEKQLRGSYGQRLVEIDAMGRRKDIVSEEPGIDGRSLALTVDLDAQRAAETFLKESLELNGAKRGSVVVMDPRNGDIVAMVSWPAFDANLFAQGISTDDYRRLSLDQDRPLFPRAIAASLPSGSTFKMSVAAAALEEGLINSRTTVNSTGGISVGIWFFPDWKYGGHGLTEVTKALADSVNTFFYAIGGGWGGITGLGVDRIVEYARKFGLGHPTGIDLVGENGGFLPSKEWKETVKGEPWYIGDTYHLAIGQGDLLVTPLQIADMTAVFANGGKLVKPRLVSALIGDDGQRLEISPETVDSQVVGQPALDLVRQGLRRAAVSGSARSLSLLSMTAAGKTGTAQWGQDRRTHAWFTGFAPYESPELVVTVAVEEGGEGSAAATPVARRFLDWWSKGQPDLGEYLAANPLWSAAPASNVDQAGETEADVETTSPETSDSQAQPEQPAGVQEAEQSGIDTSKLYFLDRPPVAP